MRRVRFLITCALLIGCDSTTTGPSSALRWPDVLHAFPSKGTAIYAPSFIAAPPDGEFMLVSYHLEGPDQGCAFYGNDPGSTAAAGDVTFLRFTAGRFQNGDFAFAERPQRNAEGLATAVVLHSVDGLKKETYPASAGTLSLSGVPALDQDWKATIRVQIHAEFVRDPVIDSECDRAMDRRTGETMGVCHCTHSSGEETTCDVGGTDGTCCVSDGPTELVYDGELDAQPCPTACEYTDPAFSQFCM